MLLHKSGGIWDVETYLKLNDLLNLVSKFDAVHVAKKGLDGRMILKSNEY